MNNPALEELDEAASGQPRAVVDNHRGAMTHATVEVFAEIVCPFTHVGLRRFVERRTQLALGQPTLRVRAWPLELVNGAPLDPELVAQHVDELREQVTPDLFRGFSRDVLPNSSLPALGLVAGAYSKGDVVGELVSLALRTALFEEGRDLADRAVLDDIAEHHGLTGRRSGARRAVLADFEEGKRRGVRGSPEFYLGNDAWFCPGLQMHKVDNRLEIAFSSERYEVFLENCFA